MDINDAKTAFRQNMDRLIRLSGKNLKEYAAEVGTTSATLSRYRAKDRLPDLDVIIPICDYAGVSLDWLFGRTEDHYNGLSASDKELIDLYHLASEDNRRVIDAILDKYRKDD